MNIIRIGLIGAGNSASNIATSLTTIPHAKLTAISAVPIESAKYIIEQHQILQNRTFSNYQELLKLPDLDMIIISVPHNLHYQMTLDALKAGKHVLCEKPLAINMKQGREMIETAKEKGLALGTFFQSRYFSASQKAKEMITKGDLGKILQAQVNVLWYRDQDYYDKSPWRGKWATEGGGSLINQASHSIDLMIWLIGKPITIFGAFAAKMHNIEVDDNAAALVLFQNGTYATIQTSTALKPGFPSAVNIFGSEGMISIDGNTLKHIDKTGQENIQNFEKQVGSANDPKKFSLEAQQRLILDFLDALQNHRAPTIDGAEGLRAIEVITAIYESNGEKVIFLK
jgi:predicted dehydrogenase